MDYATVVEGGTRLRVPVAETPSKSSEVFYNPEMELGRDITVALVRILKPRDYCDLLSASGARGVRVLVEAGVKPVLNDLNPRAVESIKKNLALNSVEAEVTRMDARALLSGRRFGFIDVDPFGPPVEFMDSVFQSIVSGGFAAVTATDTSALSGTYPKACRRKYDALPLRTDYYNELGLRILAGFVARTALRHGLGVRFVFSHATRHYMRVFLQASHKSKVVKDTLGNIRFIAHCFKCLEREYVNLESVKECGCGSSRRIAGPLWSGETADTVLCGRLLNELLEGSYNSRRRGVRMVELVGGEQFTSKPYYDVHKLASRARSSVTRMDAVLNKLSTHGFKNSRTHYNPQGVKTDAGVADIREVLK
jgi:tRNA (guanine26-N2/guanine27-N2)-dimethyltransferase